MHCPTEKNPITIPPAAIFPAEKKGQDDTAVVSIDEKPKLSQSERSSASFDVEAQKPIPKRSRLAPIRYTFLNIYRRLFTVVFGVNAIAFILVMALADRKLLALGNAAASNLLACGLARQPLVVNLMFLAACKIPRSAPLRLRYIASKVYHYGGVHSGCGVAAIAWYTGFVGWMTYEYCSTDGKGPISMATLVLAYIELALLLLIMIVAYPVFRFERHDWFELTHRFAGWLVIAIFVVLVLVFSHRASQAEGKSLGLYIIQFPAFWLLMVAVGAVAHPWVLLRKVKVQPEALSSHAVRLHFDYRNTAFGLGTQVSRHPLRDWHGFGTFPDPEGKGFSCLISKAGDWTSECINNPPTHVWQRGVFTYGFGYVMKLFHRVVLVTTGSGIGPCLGFLGDEDRAAMRVVWQTRSPHKTYGDEIVGLVSQLDPNAVIMDTNQTGRVDMVPLVRRLAREFDAEAVCVISNPNLTRKLVYELESTGTPAFGPIFDS